MMCKGVFLYLYPWFCEWGSVVTRYRGNTPGVTWAVTHKYSPPGYGNTLPG